MKTKVFVSLLFALALQMAVSAQDFSENDLIFNAGFGIGSNVLPGPDYKMTMPPVFLSGDYCVKENLGPGNLGVGGYLGYVGRESVYHDPILGEYGYRYNAFVIAARGTYHYQLIDELDTYAGLVAGYYFSSSEYYGNVYYSNRTKPLSPTVIYGFFAGARYCFTENFGAFAEVGYSTAFISVGLNYKFSLN